MHFSKISKSEGYPQLTECMGVSHEWFNKKGIRTDYAEAFVEELPELTLKPL